MEGTGPELGKVVIRKSILSPFPIEGFFIEPNIRMNRHTVIGKHSPVDSMSNCRFDKLRRYGVDEQVPGVGDHDHSRT
jgi:hypothetical protein